MKMETTVGKRLREFREYKLMKQNAFSEATGIRQQTLSTLEADGSVPSYPILEKILTAFPNLSSDWLLMGKGGMLTDDRTLIPTTQAPSESVRINSDRELVRAMTEEDMRISDTSGPPYRMRRITRTPEEEIEYLRSELLRERQAHERTRERHEADRNQNHERETLLIKRLGGKTDASADAADAEDEQPVMVAHINHNYVEPAIEPARIIVTGFVV